MATKTAEIPRDEINSEMIGYLAVHEKARARELADLVGITVPSIRYRLFLLMAKGIVGQERSKNHQVWWYLQDNEKARAAPRRVT